MKLDVVGFGALNVDKLCLVDHIAREGQESFILSSHKAPGGSAANTIVGLARLGLKTGYIGKVADDDDGRFLLNDFINEGVNINGIVVSHRGKSGSVTAFIDKKGERALYVHPSVNDTLKFTEINLGYVGCANFLHLTSVNERPFQAQRKLIEALPEVNVSFDPGELYARKSLKQLKPIIKRTFVLLPNEDELFLLTKKSWKEGAEILLKEGARIVAVKLGKKGCYVTDGDENHLVKPCKTKVVDTTGAGDAFCAGFIYGLIQNKDLHECGRIGNFVASKCIAKVGARTGLPHVREFVDL